MRYTENIHANEIVSYEVDIRAGRLILHTISPESKRTDICFTDVFAHDFNNVQTAKNVIQDIETLEFPQMQVFYKNEIPKWLTDGFSGFAVNETELEKKIKKGKLTIYAVHSTAGLSGIVFAKGMEVKN